jgi:hypothetical protein
MTGHDEVKHELDAFITALSQPTNKNGNIFGDFT